MCVPQLLSSVHEMDCLREETVPVPGCSGAQNDQAQVVIIIFKEIFSNKYK